MYSNVLPLFCGRRRFLHNELCMSAPVSGDSVAAAETTASIPPKFAER